MPPNAVDTAVQTVRDHLDSGFLDPVTHDDVKAAVDALAGLNATESRDALSRLSDDELRHLADEINDGSWFGLGGLSQGEKTDFFNAMATDLDARQLARLSQAFDRTTGWQTADDRLGAVDNIAQLGTAVARHSSDQVKLDFIRELAGSSADQSRIQTSREDRAYDPQARAIAEVVGSLQNNPAAAEQAFEMLTPEQLRSVINASTDERMQFASGPGGGFGAATKLDTGTLDALMRTASRIGDTDTKARIFEQGVAELKDVESRGHAEAATAVRNGLTQLLMSDTNGVMRELAYNTETANGSAFAGYAKSMLNAEQFDTLGEIQAQLLLGNGKNAADPVARFEESVRAPSGQPRLVNAELAGYFSGAVSAAATSITADAKLQGELITAVLKSALTVVDKAGVGGRVGGTVASVAKEWVQFPVRAAMDALIAGRVSAADAMAASMQPTRELRTLPNGLPDTELGHGSAARSAFQSTWGFVSMNAKP